MTNSYRLYIVFIIVNAYFTRLQVWLNNRVPKFFKFQKQIPPDYMHEYLL